MNQCIWDTSQFSHDLTHETVKFHKVDLFCDSTIKLEICNKNLKFVNYLEILKLFP